jgi:3-hydroxybutyryl-CoA dehydratase
LIEVKEIREKFFISEELHQKFLDCFKDFNPLHTDSEFAVSKGFKGKVMHGNILNGFISFMIGEKLPFKNVIIHKQSIKFHNPFFLQDTIECKLILSKFVESVQVYTFSFSFVREDVKIASGKIQIGLI